LELNGRLEEKDLSVWMMVLYPLWLARNDAMDEPMIENPMKTARRCLVLTEEWLLTNSEVTVKEARAVEHWLPPEPGWHKANSDGAFSISDAHEGGGRGHL
jgi:hypothetical protein